jgi:ATP-dependent RNA helicase DDX5/DBP2
MNHSRVGNAHEELVANKDVKQIVEVVAGSDKFDKLTAALAAADPAAPIIIFCNMKVRVQEIADQLWQSGASIDAIHGDKSQAEREYILKQFKRGDIKMLVATDVAARGLDIKGVDLVINYDFPRVVDDYVHRIGRTGRAGATGTAITFFDPAIDKAHAKELVKVMKDAGSQVPDALQAMVPRAGGWGGGGGGGRGGFRGRGRGGGGYGGAFVF